MDQQVAQSLTSFLRGWVQANPGWAYDTTRWPARQRSATEVAAVLVPAMLAADVRAARWLQSPDGQLIESAVAAALPWPMGFEVKLLADAVKLAAAESSKNERISVLASVAAAALLGMLLAQLLGGAKRG